MSEAQKEEIGKILAKILVDVPLDNADYVKAALIKTAVNHWNVFSPLWKKLGMDDDIAWATFKDSVGSAMKNTLIKAGL